MKKILKIIAILSFMILWANISLEAQSPIAKIIILDLNDINCSSSSQEWTEFLSDYSQYGLKLMFWRQSKIFCPRNTGHFVFDSTTINDVDIMDIMENDYRIENASIQPHRARQLVIKLIDNAYEQDVLGDYWEYGFNGSGMVPGGIPELGAGHGFYCVDDTMIYSGAFLDLLRTDRRIEFAYLVRIWEDGKIDLQIESWVNDEIKTAFMNDYGFIDFMNHNYSFYDMTACFDVDAIDEFHVLNMFHSDPRVADAHLTRYMYPAMWYYCYHEPLFVSNVDEIIGPLNKVSVYPNPAKNGGNITFKAHHIKQNSDINIFNIKGQRIKKSTFSEDTFIWNGLDENETQVKSGIYLYQIKADNDVQTGKILILK